MAERQASHREGLERFALESDAKRSDRGLAAGFVICLAFLAASVTLIVDGHDTAGAVIGTVDIVGLVGTFIYGTKSRKEERQQRVRELTPPPNQR